MTTNPLDAQIARRHSDIPQDELPLELAVGTSSASEPATRASPRSVEWAKCPDHVADMASRGGGLTGLIRTGDGLVFRDHTKRVGHQSLPCPGSGRPPPGA